MVIKTLIFRFIGKDIHGTPMADRTYFKPRVLQSNKKKKNTAIGRSLTLTIQI